MKAGFVSGNVVAFLWTAWLVGCAGASTGDGGSTTTAVDSQGGADTGVTGGSTSADAATVDSAASDSVTSDAAASDTLEADTAPSGCDPACPAHQSCDAGLCGPKACKVAADCNDATPAPGAEPFYCPDGTCRAWQCGKDEHCASDQKCNTINYTCYTPQTGCTLDAQCLDDDSCTDDICDKATGTCSHPKFPACCKVAADCNDNDPCTQEGCANGQCTWKGVAGCCKTAVDCDDGNPCTAESCTGGGCKFASIANCCSKDSQCDDGEAATVDSCVGKPSNCVHALAGKPTSCTTAADCKGGACAEASCVAGACSFAPTHAAGCCEVAATCVLGSACKASVCAAWTCESSAVVGGTVGPQLSWDFESGLDGWTVETNNATAKFHAAQGWSAHGGGALRYGVPGKETWKGGVPNSGAATSPVMVVPAGAKLSFFVFFDGDPGAGVHLFGLDAVVAGVKTPLWTKNGDLKGNTAGAWKSFTVDLAAFANKSVQLRWWFDVAVSFPKEDGKGLHVDAMVLQAPCK